MVELIFQRPLADSRARGFAKSPQTGNQAILFDSRKAERISGRGRMRTQGQRKERTHKGRGRKDKWREKGRKRKGHEGKGGEK